MIIKHIVWDWNGTLLNDSWLSIKAINILLDKYDLPAIDKEKYLEIFTFPVIDYYEKLGFDFEKIPFNIVGTEFIDEYTERMYNAQLQDGARETLECFSKMGISQSLLSAAKQQMLEDLIKFHKLEKYFIKISGLTDHYANSKVDAGKAWIKELKYDPCEVLLIGDTLHDVEVADEIGTKCVLIAQGHTSHDQLKSSDRRVFYNLHEFKGWFIKQ
ncbi:MAG: HAD hydrolase-like protein [Candidatus Marinimicrobia bacterium]|nr:HAD hydrolase-like protein [Candidatus Neomarinimicrobiota bacterium]